MCTARLWSTSFDILLLSCTYPVSQHAHIRHLLTRSLLPAPPVLPFPRPQKLPQVLPLETLKTFMTLGIEAPKGSEDVPRAIAAVEAKKAEYEEKRDKAAAEPPSEEEEEPAEVGGGAC
jgi:hypothetical protein